MENKIKKVFVKNDDDQKYLVVVRENDKKIYHDEEAEEVYNEVVQELLTILSLDENDYQELFDKKIIEVVDNDLISEIIYYDDDSKFIVKYYSGKSEEFLNDEVYDNLEFDELYDQKLATLCAQYGLSEKELESLGIISIKDSKKRLNTVVSDLKVKNLKLAKRIVAYILAGAILSLGGYGVVKHVSKNKDNKPKNKQEYSYEEDTYINNDIPEVTISPVVTAEPTPFVPEVEHISDVHHNPTSLNETINQYETDENLAMLYIKGDEIKPYYISDQVGINIDDLLLACQNDMDNLANYMQNGGESLIDYTMMVYPENFFYDPIDKAFVRYFSDYLRQIYYGAFINGDMTLTKEYIDSASYDIISIIRDGNPIQIEIEGQMVEVTFDQISPEAKRVVLELAWNIYKPLDDTFTYGAEVFNKEQFAKIITDAYNNISKSY